MKRILNHIKHFIYKRKELKRLNECLYVLKEAKAYYDSIHYFGMCNALIYIVKEKYKNEPHRIKLSREWIKNNIPEFNLKYLIGENRCDEGYWWDIRDIDSRIEAFNKLIKLYETKIKEL